MSKEFGDLVSSSFGQFLLQSVVYPAFENILVITSRHNMAPYPLSKRLRQKLKCVMYYEAGRADEGDIMAIVWIIVRNIT